MSISNRNSATPSPIRDSRSFFFYTNRKFSNAESIEEEPESGSATPPPIRAGGNRRPVSLAAIEEAEWAYRNASPPPLPRKSSRRFSMPCDPSALIAQTVKNEVFNLEMMEGYSRAKSWNFSYPMRSHPGVVTLKAFASIDSLREDSRLRKDSYAQNVLPEVPEAVFLRDFSPLDRPGTRSPQLLLPWQKEQQRSLSKSSEYSKRTKSDAGSPNGRNGADSRALSPSSVRTYSSSSSMSYEPHNRGKTFQSPILSINVISNVTFQVSRMINMGHICNAFAHLGKRTSYCL